MTDQEIQQEVHELLVGEFKVSAEAIEPEATFKELGLDSLDMVSLAMSLEDRLGVQIPDEELSGIERYGQALELLQRQVGAPA